LHTSLCHQAVYCGTSRTAAMFCGWEGNHRLAGTLAMCHRLSSLSTVGLKAQVIEWSAFPHSLWGLDSLCVRLGHVIAIITKI